MKFLALKCRPIVLVLGGGILLLVAGLASVVLLSSTLGWPAPLKHWRHPFDFREGVQMARKDIATGSAVIWETSCVVVGPPRVDEATGLPVHVTGMLTEAGVAWFDGYMGEVERARRGGRLGSSSVRGKVRTRQAAITEFLAGKCGEVERGKPAVLSPSGRYRVEVARPAWDNNPIRFTYECQVVDTQAVPGDRPLTIACRVEEKERIRFLFADSESSVFVYARSELTLYDFPHGCAIAAFGEVELPTPSGVHGGR